MGLSMTLTKDKNRMYHDFVDAYWAIDNVIYSVDQIDFSLIAYPSRESKLMNYEVLRDPTIGFGSSYGAGSVDSPLYLWHVRMALTNIFPDGSIPSGKDSQYTAIYNWIKSYTGLPFEDVIES